MPLSHGSSARYFPISSDDGSETELEKLRDIGDFREGSQRRWSIFSFLVCVFVLCFPLSFAIRSLLESSNVIHGSTAMFSSQACPNPPTRREWRSLSRDEKKDYLVAVQCLRETPSRLGLNQSLYDDFPWVHIRVGGYCMTFLLFCTLDIFDNLFSSEAHGSAAFLAWHRYFIHTYEQALSRQCNYKGALTYVLTASSDSGVELTMVVATGIGLWIGRISRTPLYGTTLLDSAAMATLVLATPS